MHRIDRDKLPYKLAVAYASLFSLLTGVIFFIVYQVLASGEENRMDLSYRLYIEQPLKQMERFLDEMDNIAYNAMTSRELIMQYTLLRGNPAPENYFDSQVIVSIDATSVLAGINRGMTRVWRISAYNHLGDYIYSGATADESKTRKILERRDTEGLMKSFALAEAEFYLPPPGADEWSDYYKSSYVTLIRPIMNIYSRDVVGLVEVQNSVSILNRYIAGLPRDELAVNIYGVDGQAIIDAGAQGEAVASAVSERYGWRVELIESGNALQNAKGEIFSLLFSLWLTVSLVVLAIIVLISRYISRPLTALAKNVADINVLNPEKLAEIKTGISEVNALQTAFNQVIERLLLSAEEEKRAFLLAMQAQMQPHFIYNVLSVIVAAALDGRGEQVAGICANLSAMLRYTSGFDRSVATVSEELEHTRLYLELMKARYDYMFEYTITAEPSLLTAVIPKLTIQPICENAFTHAFSRMEPPYRLGLNIGREPGGWSISVLDNGPGINPEIAMETMKKTEAFARENLSRMHIGGMGLVSTVLRLRLLTGRETGLLIENTPPHGAAVKLTIPLD